MPTLLEALEEKYGFAQTSDIEAEPELLVLRLPKRTPRQRWLSLWLSIVISPDLASHIYRSPILFVYIKSWIIWTRRLPAGVGFCNESAAFILRHRRRPTCSILFIAFLCPFWLTKRIIKTRALLISFLSHSLHRRCRFNYAIHDNFLRSRAACRKYSCWMTAESIRPERRKTSRRNAIQWRSSTWRKTNWKIGMR